MKLCIFFLNLNLLFSAPVVSNIVVDSVGVSTARVTWDSTGSPNAQRLRWGTTTSYEGGAVGGIQIQRDLSLSSGYQMAISALPPGTLIHICPQSSDDSGATWAACVDTTFTTSTQPGVWPELPVAPETFSTSYPSTGGYTTRTVASDCSDLQTKIDAAVANQSTAGSIVSISAGTTCTGSYTTPTDPAARSFTAGDVNTGTDKITVTSHGWSAGQQIRFARVGCLPNSSGGFCQLNGIIQGKIYYVKSPGTNDIQISATSGGTAIDLTATGSGTNYITPWPPAHSNSVIIRTDTSDTNFCPEKTRCLGSLWSSKMAKMQLTGGTWNSGAFVFTPGIGAHHIRLTGIEITHSDATSNLAGSSDPRPTYGLVNMDPANALGYITLDRVYFHGLGYPNRIYRPLYQWDGKYMAIVDSDMPNWDFWRPGRTGSAVTFSTQTATIASGTYTMRASQPCTYGALTFTRTAGATAATSYIYLALDCTPTIVVPTGTSATCTGTATDYLGNVRACSVASAASPDWARDSFGGFACGVLAQVDYSAGTWSTAYDPYGNAPSYYITEGTQGMIGGWGPGPYKLENNYSEGAGLLWHFDDSAGANSVGSGYSIKRNTFTMLSSKREGSSDTTGLRYMQRNGIEWKNGTNTLIEGNTWSGFWADVSSTGCNIVMTGRSGGSINDVEVKYNTASSSVCFINIIGGIPFSGEGVSTPFVRGYVHDNQILSSNGWTQLDGRTLAANFIFYYGYAAESLITTHNLVYDFRSPYGQVFHQIAQPNSGVKVTDNIFHAAADAGTYGFGNEFPGGTASPNCTSSNKAGRDCAWISGVTTSYTWGGNLYIPTYTDSSVPSGLADTTAAAAANTDTTVQTGASVAARTSAVGWRNTSTSDFTLLPSSSYCAGCGLTTDKFAPGPDMKKLASSQGVVINTRVINVTSTAAEIYWTAPDSQVCSVDVGTDVTPSSGSWTRYDSGTSPAVNTNSNDISAGTAVRQSLVLSGLASGTKQFRVNCAVMQSGGSWIN